MKITDLQDYQVVSPTMVSSGGPASSKKQKTKKGGLQKVLDVGTGISNFIGAKGISEQFGATLAKRMVPKEQRDLVEEPGLKKVLGSAVQTGSLLVPGGAGTKIASKVGKTAAKIGAGAATGYGMDVGSKLQEDKTVPESLVPGAGTAIGAALPGAGSLFNLTKKAIPATLSFTSGVPQRAIKKAIESPEATKIGRVGGTEEVRGRAVEELKNLSNTLRKEFRTGLDEVVSKTGQTKSGVVYDEKGFLKSGKAIKDRLTDFSKRFAREFNLSTKTTPEGVSIDFSKSPIVKTGEKSAVQEAFSTISNWDDWSAKGMQNLVQRIGNLRKFDSGAKTESSAIVGKIYNRLAGSGEGKARGIIEEFFPDLHSLRTNYASKRKLINEIDDVLQMDKKNPRAIQSSISRLTSIFKEDKETYLNVIRQLSDKSGVDILGMLAGSEFQRYLPTFIRGLGGGGALAAGAALLNPYLLLLAPLFSPRMVGKGIEFGAKTKPVRKALTSTANKLGPMIGTDLNQ